MSHDFGAPPGSGKGLPAWAWYVIVPAGCAVIAVPFFAAIVLPLFARADETKKAVLCLSNVKQQSQTLLMYAQDYDETLPKGGSWSTLTASYRTNFDIMRCPSGAEHGGYFFGYAYNWNLSAAKLKSVKSPAETPMIYDSTQGGQNATDKVISLPNPGRHLVRDNVGFVDGHAAAVLPEQVAEQAASDTDTKKR